MAALNHAGAETGDIPHFLRVKNRKPLTKKQREALDRRIAALGSEASARVDYRKPKGMSWEDWDALEAVRTANERAKTEARISVLQARPTEPKVPRLPGYKGHLAGSRKERVHRCHDKEGPVAAVKLAAELDLKEGTARAWMKGWALK